jgi:hypothetical protein
MAAFAPSGTISDGDDKLEFSMDNHNHDGTFALDGTSVASDEEPLLCESASQH